MDAQTEKVQTIEVSVLVLNLLEEAQAGISRQKCMHSTEVPEKPSRKHMN